jgi:AcrR family transcriptional regulator
VPKLWNQTIEAHRRDVARAILAATADLVAERGVAGVTMSQVAETAGIGRATLYKYFPDIDSVLTAWHQEQVRRHVGELVAVRDRVDGAARRLEAVLHAYASMTQARPHGTDVAAVLHRGPHVDHATEQLRDIVRDLIADGARAGEVRDDVPPEELAVYCLHALSAAGGLPSGVGVERLIAVIMAGLRPPL